MSLFHQSTGLGLKDVRSVLLKIVSVLFFFCFPETAVNIGYSCRLLTDSMKEVFLINAEDMSTVEEQLDKAVADIKRYSSNTHAEDFQDGDVR